MKGTIKRLVADKGFGFILAEDGFEYFFHRSTCVRNFPFEQIRQGDAVEFTEEEGPKGPRAASVEKA